MSETVNETKRRKRTSRVPARSVGERLAMDELKRRGFDARPTGSISNKLLVWAGDSAPKPVQVRTVHSTPWSVRRGSFAKRADQVTVYVLLGAKPTGHARFFVVKDNDLANEVRQPPISEAFLFIDAKALDKYEDNWEILK